MATQDSIGKDSIDKLSIVEDSVVEEKATKRKRFVPPTLEDVKAYCQERQKADFIYVCLYHLLAHTIMTNNIITIL